MDGKVTATAGALELLAEIVADHGPVLFHRSGGCCDGSSPMCYPQGEFLIGEADVRLGEIGGAPFYIGRAQFEVWKHTDLIIDVVPGRGGMFSLDNGRERRFLTRSTVCALPIWVQKPFWPVARAGAATVIHAAWSSRRAAQRALRRESPLAGDQQANDLALGDDDGEPRNNATSRDAVTCP